MTATEKANLLNTTDCRHPDPLARAVAIARRDYRASWKLNNPRIEAEAEAKFNAARAALAAKFAA